MATTVDTLLVRIEADMSDLKRDLARVAKTTEATGQRMEGAFRKVGRAIAALGGAYVFGNFIKSTIQTGAEIEGLRVQLDALLGSAEQGGKAFDQMAEFAGRVPFSLAEIQAGSGSLAAASDNADELGELLQVTGNIAAQFGIPFNEAAANVQRALSAGIGSADLFRDKGVTAFAGFEAGVTYSAGETAKKLLENFGTGGTSDGAMDAFAKTTAGVVSMFGDAMHRMRGNIAQSGLNEGFRDLVKAITDVTNASGPLAQAIGQTLGNAFSALADAIRFAQAMFQPLVDLMSSAIQIVKTIGVALYAAFGPQLRVILDAVQAAFAVVHDNLKLIVTAAVLYKTVNVASALLDGAVQAIRFAKSLRALALAQKLVNIVSKRSLGFYVAIAALFATITGLSGELERAIIAVGNEVLNMLPPELRKDFGDFASELDGVKDAYEAAEAALSEDGPLQTEVSVDPVKQAAADLKAIQDALAATGAAGAAGGLKELQKTINANISPVHALRKEYNMLKAAMDAAGDRAGPKLVEAFNNVQQKLYDMNPVFANLRNSAQTAFDTISDALTNMVETGKFDLDNLKDVFRQTLRQMIADAVQAQVIKPLLSSAFGFIGSAIGGPVGTIIGSIGKAGGGDIDRPTLVGERGPELFVPHSAGTILNNHNTKNALGGGGGTAVYQTINVSAGVSQTVRAEMMSLLPRFKQDTMAAVVDAKRRGGSFGQAFG